MSQYDRSISVFSPDGHLFQVEYANNAVTKGALTIGVCGEDSSVLCVERQCVDKLQDPRLVSKIQKINEHTCLAFSGLTADARIVIHRARVDAQSHKLSLDEAARSDQISSYIGSLKQKYTQSGGVRPFGIASLISGFSEGKSKLFHSDPSGTVSEWKAKAIGRNSKAILEWLEGNYKQTSGIDTINLAVRAILQAVDDMSSKIEVVVIDKSGIRKISDEMIEKMIEDLIKES